MVDVAALLVESRESPPCGPNLEHDLSFFELEEASRGKPEQQSGNAIIPGEEPRWPKVGDLAQAFLVRSKDLRAAVLLTRALAHTDGVPGVATGLALIHEYLQRYWEHLHPVLEADADNDPTERLNALAPLADPDALVKDVRDLDLITSREHGKLQSREVEIALGRLPGSRQGGAAPKPLDQIQRQLSAAFASDRTVPDALHRARDSAAAIQTLVAERVGGARAIDLKPLVQPLETLIEACETALGGGATESAGATEPSAAGSSGGAAAVPGEIRSRQDALRHLDLVCSYLARYEPSNPAPLFIRRAQRLMQKDFVEIVKDLLPDSLSQLDKLAGGLDKTD